MTLDEEASDELVRIVIGCDSCGTRSGGYDRGNGSVVDQHLERGWQLDHATGQAACPDCR